MTCRHGNAHNCGRPCATASGETLAFAFRWCDDCLDYVPLGPSDETDPRVAVEIRAAELAGHMSWFLGGPGAPVDTIDKSELRGCSQHRNNGTPANDHEHAGYLARCIADHDSATEREGRR